MGATGVLFIAYCVVLYLLQMVALSSEEFTVSGLTRPVLAPFGGNLELSCQLSPPQPAQHMEIRWFRNRYTQPVHLYRDGKDMFGETTSKYVERTELLKDALGEGKVTLRVYNVTVDDDGPYHCVFKDGEFYEEHITEVKVIATGSDIQILMHPPNIKGVMLECHSEGWFPLPHMEWRDRNGQVIPATSKSYLQNGSKMFNMTMTLFIENSSHQNITCCLQNSLTHQEETIHIFLSGELFSWKSVWIQILGMITCVLTAFFITSFFQKHLILALNLRSTTSPSRSSLRNAACSSPENLGSCSERICHWLKRIMVVMTSVIAIIGAMLILHLKQGVSVSDPHFELNTLWLEDISVILFVLIVFKTKLISFPYFRLDGYTSKFKAGSRLFSIIVIILQFLSFIILDSVFLLLQHQLLAKVSISDALYSLYRSWASKLEIIMTFLVLIFVIASTILTWTYIKNCRQALAAFLENDAESE